MNTVASKMEALRREWVNNVRPRPELLEKAIAKLEEKLEAKETKFFAHQGMVVSEVEVEAHGVQIEAAQLLAKMGDAFPKERADTKQVPQVALEIKDGVFRLVIGSSGEEAANEVKQLPSDTSEDGGGHGMRLVPGDHPRDMSGQPSLSTSENVAAMPQAQDRYELDTQSVEFVSKMEALKALRGEK